jgi:di/tricarboxylate transporter
LVFLNTLILKESGLSNLIGAQLKSLSSTNEKITLLIVTVVSAIATEFTSNMSMASVLLPIVDSLVRKY